MSATHPLVQHSSFLAYQTMFSAIFTSSVKSYLTYPYLIVGKIKTNNNTCCQYIGCIEGHVTLSLRRWKLTSLRRHILRQL